MSDETLAQLQAQEKELAEKLDEVRAEIHRRETESASEKYGVKAGDIVACRNGEYRVTLIKPFDYGEPWLMGVKRLKSGGFGQRVVQIYGKWEVIDANQ